MAPTYEGTPCKRGHTLRYVNSRNCVECQRAKSRDGWADPDRRAHKLAYHRTYVRKRYYEAKDAGVCVKCGDQTLSEALCWSCLSKKQDYSIGG